MKKTAVFVVLLVVVSLSAKGERVVSALNGCGNPRCFLMADFSTCLPQVESLPPCFQDEANKTFLFFVREKEKGECIEPNGQPGYWYRRAQWSPACGACCFAGCAGGEKFDYSPEEIGLILD